MLYTFSDSEYADMDPFEFKELLNTANIQDPQEASQANEILSAMMLEAEQAPPLIPTRPPKLSEGCDEATGDCQDGEDGQGAGADGDNPTDPPETTTKAMTKEDLAKEQLTVQSIMSTMMSVDGVKGIRTAEEVELRLPVAIVGANVVSAKEETKKKWDAVYELHKNEEGAIKTVRELQEFMLAYVGQTNISSPTRTKYFDPDTDSMKYATSGENFGRSWSY